jgi:hypothetical protein
MALLDTASSLRAMAARVGADHKQSASPRPRACARSRTCSKMPRLPRESAHVSQIEATSRLLAQARNLEKTRPQNAQQMSSPADRTAHAGALARRSLRARASICAGIAMQMRVLHKSASGSMWRTNSPPRSKRMRISEPSSREIPGLCQEPAPATTKSTFSTATRRTPSPGAGPESGDIGAHVPGKWCC